LSAEDTRMWLREIKVLVFRQIQTLPQSAKQGRHDTSTLSILFVSEPRAESHVSQAG